MKSKIFAALGLAVIGTGCTPPVDRPTATKTSEGQTASGPAAAKAAKRGRALVRFVNAEPTIDKADLWFGDDKAFSGVAYKQITPYEELPGDRQDFRLRGTGMTNDLAANSEGLKAGRHYTIVAMRKADNSTLLSAFSESMEASARGKARVRFINAAPAGGDLALGTAGKAASIFSGVKFGSGTGFKDVDAGATVFEVRSVDRKTGGVRVQNRVLEEGKLYTLITLGDGNQDVLLIEDELLHKTSGGR